MEGWRERLKRLQEAVDPFLDINDCLDPVTWIALALDYLDDDADSMHNFETALTELGRLTRKGGERMKLWWERLYLLKETLKMLVLRCGDDDPLTWVALALDYLDDDADSMHNFETALTELERLAK